MIRAKFVVNSIERSRYANSDTIRMLAIYDDSTAENRRFSKATPSGKLEMIISVPEALSEFELGREFYLDFTPVDQTLTD
jgi:hypothetical protein